MSGIFISYRRDETSAWAFIVNGRLGARFGADKIFMDIDSIEPGDDFVEVIKNKVGACEHGNRRQADRRRRKAPRTRRYAGQRLEILP